MVASESWKWLLGRESERSGMTGLPTFGWFVFFLEFHFFIQTKNYTLIVLV